MEAAVHEDGPLVRVVLSGPLNKQNNLAVLARQLRANIGDRPLAIDLSGIHRINSVGVRDWILFLRALQDTRDLALERCSSMLVVQLNTVYNFRGHARIVSVMAPFVCLDCDHEQEELIDLSDADASLFDLIGGDSHRCQSCGAACELDDLPSRYFMFREA